MPGPIRVMIVDDHPIVLEGLRSIIDRQPGMKVVASAATGAEAVERFNQNRPDVTLMDLRLPDISGVEAIEQIRKANPHAKILVLTTFDGDEMIRNALSAGARGYLLKNMDRESLLSSIHKVAAGQIQVAPPVAVRLVEAGPPPGLTRREIDVLKLAAKGQSNKIIGEALGLTEGSVKAYMRGAIMKLGVSDRTGAVTEALKRGIITLT